MADAKKKKKRGMPTMPVDSFSDIAFLLIIFFIIATTLEKMSGVVTDMPSGQKGQSSDKKVPTVQIHGDRYTFNDSECEIDGLRKSLSALKLSEKKGTDKIVILEAQGDVEYQCYFEAMAAINKVGGMILLVKEDK